MLETKTEALFSAWLGLPDEKRAGIEATLREVFDLSCENGSCAILDEARWQLKLSPEGLEALVKGLAELPNRFHRAMPVYPDYPQCWNWAIRFYRAGMPQHWRKPKHLGCRPGRRGEREAVGAADWRLFPPHRRPRQ